jgi:hypothetical protein
LYCNWPEKKKNGLTSDSEKCYWLVIARQN